MCLHTRVCVCDINSWAALTISWPYKTKQVLNYNLSFIFFAINDLFSNLDWHNVDLGKDTLKWVRNNFRFCSSNLIFIKWNKISIYSIIYSPLFYLLLMFSKEIFDSFNQIAQVNFFGAILYIGFHIKIRFSDRNP